jgi:replicative DNA helicase
MPPSKLELDALRALVGEASVSVAGAVEVLDETGVKAEDCPSPEARTLWAVLEATLRAGEPLDQAVLPHRCSTLPRAFVVEVLEGGQMGVASQRLALLRQESLRRQYIDALRQVARVVKDTAQPLANAVQEAGRLLASWQDETVSGGPLDDAMAALVNDLEAAQLGNREPVVRTGLTALDAVVGGLQPTLTVVGALPGVGKSALVAGICRQLASRDVTVGLLSLEDERSWLVRRLMAQAAQVPVFVLANRPLVEGQLKRVWDVGPDVQRLLAKVLCDDRQGLTTAEVVASARRMVSRGAKAIFVDHLGEVRLERTDRHDLDISDCLRELRAVAKANRVPVVVLTHLRRREGLQVDSEPRLTDFAFSSGVERMARVALGLWKDASDATRLNCTVLKQTQGVAGVTVGLELNAMAGVVVETPGRTVPDMYGGET